MWRLGTRADHCVFCREDSCSGESEPTDHCIAVWFPLPRGKISSGLLLATACCSGCGCVPIIQAFGVWWLPTCTEMGPQAFLEEVGGWEKWCHVLCFVSVLHKVSTELGCVVSFVTLILCGEKKKKQRWVLLQHVELQVARTCHINAELALLAFLLVNHIWRLSGF